MDTTTRLFTLFREHGYQTTVTQVDGGWRVAVLDDADHMRVAVAEDVCTALLELARQMGFDWTD